MKSTMKIMRNYFWSKLQVYLVDSYCLITTPNATNLKDIPKTPFTEFAKPKGNSVSYNSAALKTPSSPAPSLPIRCI